MLKEIIGIGESLSGRLLIWDALAARFRTIAFRRDPSCPSCGDAPTITDLSATAPMPPPAPPERFGVLLLSGDHARAHYAFVLATGAAALGRAVTLFATNEGCRALLADWSGLADAGRDARVQAAGVAGLADAARGGGRARHRAASPARPGCAPRRSTPPR